MTSEPRNNFETKLLTTLEGAASEHHYSVKYESEKLKYKIESTYTPDYVITFLPSGHKRYIESKGYFRPADRAKMRAVLRDNPGIDLRIIFQKDLPQRKGAKTFYSTWAIKNGIPYAINSIPKDWFVF